MSSYPDHLKFNFPDQDKNIDNENCFSLSFNNFEYCNDFEKIKGIELTIIIDCDFYIQKKALFILMLTLHLSTLI